MLVAIHQPNFLPWLGWFDKLARADRLVLLDDVQTQLTGGNYTNRVKFLINGKPSWITVPLARGHEARKSIDTTPIAEDRNWRHKIIQTIRQSYSRAPYFAETFELIEPLLSNRAGYLGPYNIPALRALADAIGLGARQFVLSSELAIDGRSTDRLVAIVQAVGGSTYLTGGGASYQDDAIFAAAGIGVARQNFVHPTYPQFNSKEFVSHLSIVDALMNVGCPRAGELLKASTP
jgi:hypothetical protein